MIQKIRVGLVGAGFAARFHMECLARIYGVQVEVTGVTSLRKESRERFGAEHGVKPFDNVAVMLPHIDLLDICSPPYVHEEAIIQAAEAGKGIICEKPLTGAFGPAGAGDSFRGDKAPKEEMLKGMEQLIHHFKIVVHGFQPPPGDVYFSIESPKGEIGCYIVSDGSKKPYRVHFRPPSFVNISALPKLVVGRMLADVIACIGSLDIVLGENDR